MIKALGAFNAELCWSIVVDMTTVNVIDQPHAERCIV